MAKSRYRKRRKTSKLKTKSKRTSKQKKKNKKTEKGAPKDSVFDKETIDNLIKLVQSRLMSLVTKRTK